MKKFYMLWCALVSVSVFAQDYNASLIPENLLKDANAVVRESAEDYVLKSVKELQLKQTPAVTILNSAGDEFSTVVIPYNPNTKVSNIKVEVYDAAG